MGGKSREFNGFAYSLSYFGYIKLVVFIHGPTINENKKQVVVVGLCLPFTFLYLEWLINMNGTLCQKCHKRNGNVRQVVGYLMRCNGLVFRLCI